MRNFVRFIIIFVQVCTAFQAESRYRRSTPRTTRLQYEQRPPLGVSDVDDRRWQDLKLALQCMERLQVEDCIDCLGQLKKRIQKTVEVRESLIPGAGRGLFASKNIKAGTIVCFYPVHGLGIDFDYDSICLGATEADQKFFDSDPTGDYIHYLIGSRAIGTADFGGASLFIDVNPERPVVAPWLGHFVNDGSTVESASETGLLEYYQRTTDRKNCHHVPFASAPILATVTTRKVLKGEELLTSYGGQYWLGENDDDNDDDDDSLVTDAVVQAAKSMASDIFDAMQRSQKVHVNEIEALTKAFETDYV